jgi:peptidoglycan-associated lipoprotein
MSISRNMWKYSFLLLIICSLCFMFSCGGKKSPSDMDGDDKFITTDLSKSKDLSKDLLKSEDLSKSKKTETENAPEENKREIFPNPERRSEIDEIKKMHAQEALEDKEKRERHNFLIKDIYFDFDSSIIKLDAIEILREKTEWLVNNSVDITIEGYCDNRGTNAYNLALGERRAKSVKKFLIDLGISPYRIETISYGEEFPVALGNSEAVWSKNRRVHFVVND